MTSITPDDVPPPSSVTAGLHKMRRNLQGHTTQASRRKTIRTQAPSSRRRPSTTLGNRSHFSESITVVGAFHRTKMPVAWLLDSQIVHRKNDSAPIFIQSWRRSTPRAMVEQVYRILVYHLQRIMTSQTATSGALPLTTHLMSLSRQISTRHCR